jgi:hypothetical protein
MIFSLRTCRNRRKLLSRLARPQPRCDHWVTGPTDRSLNNKLYFKKAWTLLLRILDFVAKERANLKR